MLLGPLFGQILTDRSLIITLAIYTIAILVRNIVDGLRARPRLGDAMPPLAVGYTPRAATADRGLPLALPAIIAGLRVATVSTISLVSVGGAIGLGGLGFVFYHGYSRGLKSEIWAGLVASVILAVAMDLLIVLIGRALTPWARRARAGSAVNEFSPVKNSSRSRGWLTTASNWSGTRRHHRARFWEHVQYSALALAVAVVIALPVGLVMGHIRRGSSAAVASERRATSDADARHPGAAVPAGPVTLWPAIVALVVLAIPPILANTIVGIEGVDPSVRDAASGHGPAGAGRAVRRRGARWACPSSSAASARRPARSSRPPRSSPTAAWAVSAASSSTATPPRTTARSSAARCWSPLWRSSSMACWHWRSGRRRPASITGAVPAVPIP